MDTQNITHNTIPAALMTAWEGDLFGLVSSSTVNNYCRVKKIVVKCFQLFWKMEKVFQNIF